MIEKLHRIINNYYCRVKLLFPNNGVTINTNGFYKLNRPRATKDTLKVIIEVRKNK